MPAKQKPPKPLPVPRIQVSRCPYDGKIFSEVWALDENQRETGVVIDRERGRSLDPDGIEYRATRLAKLLNIPLHVDKSWVCLALKKQPCRCPKCCNQIK